MQQSNIIAALSNGASFSDPMKTYQNHKLLRNIRRKDISHVLTSSFWLDPKLREWTASEQSALTVVRGNFSSRFLIRDFGVDIIEQLRAKDVPVFWVFKSESGDSNPPSRAEVIRHLITDMIRNDSKLTEKSLSLSCAQIHTARADKDWFSILESVLARMDQQIYIIIDLEALRNSTEPESDFSWPAAFLNLFHEFSKRLIFTKVKVLFLCCHPTRPINPPAGTDLSSCSVTVKSMLVPVRHNKLLIRHKTNSATIKPFPFILGKMQRGRL